MKQLRKILILSILCLAVCCFNLGELTIANNDPGISLLGGGENQVE